MNHRMIEELSLNHWQPLSTLIYDGWLLRFAEGYTKRANSISSLYASSIDVEHKIKHCEALYREQNQPTIFKITPFVEPSHLDGVLAKLDYQIVDRTSVQTTSLQHLAQPTISSVTIEEAISERWLTDFSRLSGIDSNRISVMYKMLANIKAKKGFISLHYNNQVIGCGFGVIEHGYIGLYDIVIDTEYRNRGFAEQMILNLLHYGKAHGAEHSYLAVVANNVAALTLYQKLGYYEVYRYWYRVKSTLME